MPTTKGQQKLNRSLVVGAGNYPITGCAREHEFSRFLPSPWKKLALTTDATWIGPDWIDQSQWLTKQQKDRDRVTGVEQTQSNPECPPPSPPPPPPPPPLYSCSPQSSCIPTVSVWCMWLFKLKTITFFTAITVWKCKSRTTSRGMIHYKISKAAAASAKTNNIFGLMMEPVFFEGFQP